MLGLPIKLTLAISLAYILGAQLGFQFALTPYSPTTLFWPPSGIALAALILAGHRAIPGILIGALVINVLSLSEGPTAAVIIGQVVTAIASTCSAIITHALITRYARSAPVWTSAQDILRGTLAMVIGSFIAAVFGVGSIYYTQALPAEALWTTIGMWWLGDFCGMVIFTPIVFACARRVGGKFWVRLRPEVFVAPTALNCISVLIALFSFYTLWSIEGRAVDAALNQEAALAANRIEQILQQAERDIDSIGALASSWGKNPGEIEFLNFVSRLYGDRKENLRTEAVAWAPLVKNPGLWELQMLARNGTPTQLVELDEAGSRIPVNKRADYFPVQYIHSQYHPAEEAIGYDVGSHPKRRDCIENARHTGSPAVAAPINLAWADRNDRRGMQICRPVYSHSTPLDDSHDRRDAFQGVVCGIYQLHELLKQAPGNDVKDIIYQLSDSLDYRNSSWHYTLEPLAGRKERAVYKDRPTNGLPHEYRGGASVRFADQQWQVFTTPGEAFVQSRRSWLPWSTLLLMVTLGIVGSSIMIERANARRKVYGERRKALEALHEARAANEAKSYFMAAASHDIKQPLYALGILTDTMLMTDPPEATIPIMKSLQKSIAEMSQHFDTLMDVGRFQDGSFEAKPTVFSLVDLESRIALEIGPLCREKSLNWHIDFDNVPVYSDPELLLRLLRNLLINAVRYTPQGEIRCTAKQHGANVEITVSDTGSGLSSSQRDLVFREVVQLEGRAVHTSVHGLGLSIVNKIGKSLNIEIDVSSDEDKGTTFTFAIPVASEPSHA